jgi:hypothetical protein
VLLQVVLEQSTSREVLYVPCAYLELKIELTIIEYGPETHWHHSHPQSHSESYCLHREAIIYGRQCFLALLVSDGLPMDLQGGTASVLDANTEHVRDFVGGCGCVSIWVRVCGCIGE